MLRTATIMFVSVFASGLCAAPFAMATPAKEKKVKYCNLAAAEMSADERKPFLDECLLPMTRSASEDEHREKLSKREKFCNKAASKMSADDRTFFLQECLSEEPAPTGGTY